MRRVEEEMRKRERIEAERKEREKLLSEQQAEEERKALEECERYAQTFSIFIVCDAAVRSNKLEMRIWFFKYIFDNYQRFLKL